MEKLEIILQRLDRIETLLLMLTDSLDRDTGQRFRQRMLERSPLYGSYCNEKRRLANDKKARI